MNPLRLSPISVCTTHNHLKLNQNAFLLYIPCNTNNNKNNNILTNAYTVLIAWARHHLSGFHTLTEPSQQHSKLGLLVFVLFPMGTVQRKLRADLGGDWASCRTSKDHCGESGMSQKKSTEERLWLDPTQFPKATVKMLAFILKANGRALGGT